MVNRSLPKVILSTRRALEGLSGAWALRGHLGTWTLGGHSGTRTPKAQRHPST